MPFSSGGGPLIIPLSGQGRVDGVALLSEADRIQIHRRLMQLQQAHPARAQQILQRQRASSARQQRLRQPPLNERICRHCGHPFWQNSQIF